MAHQRSPNCPQVTFQEVAEKGRLLYQREHTHPANKEVVAQSIGYSGINGRSLSMIGALRQYGIIEGPGEGLRVTEDAVTYFELESGAERAAALSRMLFTPPVFAQIHQEFGDTLPSEQNLKYYLIKQGFLPKAAEDVISVYRENIRLVENKPSRYNEDVIATPDKTSGTPAGVTLSTPPQLVASAGSVHAFSSSDYTFPLGKGTFADVRIRGDVTAKSLSLLRSHIELLIDALSDQDKGEPNPE